MEAAERETLLELCRKYLREMRLPQPLPTTRDEAKAYVAVIDQLQASEDAEDAWFELDHLAFGDPVEAWDLIRALARTTSNEDELGTLGAGVLETFVSYHGDAWADAIESEMLGNPGFAIAMQMVRGIEDHPQLNRRVRRFLPE